MNSVSIARSAWRNLLSSGIDEDLHSPSMRRVVFTNIFALTAAVGLFLFAIVNIVEANRLILSVGELALALFAIFITIYLRKTHNIVRTQTLGMIVTILLGSMLLFTGGMAKTGIFWLYILPPLAFYLKGKRWGWAWLAIVGVEVVIMIALRAASIGSMPYSIITLRQFSACFFVLSLFISNFERIRDDYEADIAVKTKELVAEIRERKQVESIQKIQRNIATAMIETETLADFLETVRKELSALLDTTNFLVALYDEASDTLSAPFEKDEKDAVPQWPAEKSLTGTVIRQKRSMLLSREQIWQMFQAGKIELIGSRAEAWLGVPLMNKDKALGAIVVQSYDNSGAYDLTSVSLLELISNQMSTYIDRKRTEEKLRESEERYRTLIENASDLVYRTDREGKFIFMNQAALKISGYEEKELIGKYLPSLIRSDMRRKAFVFFVHQLISGTPNLYSEFPILTKAGHEIWVGQNSQLIWENGQVTGFQAVSRDITERRRAEEETKRQLAEKEILLREVHHRIKNNIASVGGLISLRLQAISNPAAVAVLQDAVSRVNSMQVLYEKLLLSEGYMDVSVENYISSLADQVVALFPTNTKITLDKQFADFHLDPKRLFSLGIIINELLTNIMKYAFINRESGLIKITLTFADCLVTLTIQDDGNGLPDGFDLKESKGFGLMLVKMLSQQLGGSFSMENHKGTRCTIKFNA